MFFSALIFSAFLEFGGLLGGIYNYTKVPIENTTIIPLYTKMSAEVSYEGLYVGGQMDCYFLAKTVTNFVPFQNTYIFRLGYRKDAFEIGYEHSCFHPFSTYSNLTVVEDEIKPKYEGGIDRVFVKFRLKN